MKKLSFPHRATERGQSLVEIAVSLVILVTLLTGAVEFGIALFQYVAIRDAAQEAAVYASINAGDTSGIQWHAVAAANDVLQLTTGNVAVAFNNGKSCEGSSVSGVPNAVIVTVTFSHPITFPFVAEMIGHTTIPLGASVTNTILTPRCSPP